MRSDPADDEPLSLRTGRGRRVLVPVLLAVVQNPLNSSMMVTALVPIGAEFHASPAHTVWLVAALYLSTAIFQTTMGKLVDVFGARRTMVFGLTIVAVAGVLGSFAPSLGLLLAARVLLGIGTSSSFPSAMAILRRVNGDGRPIPAGALSMLTIFGQVSVSFGPALAGFLVVALGWRAIMWMNIPAAVLALVMTLAWLPRDDRPAVRNRNVAALVDIPGILLFALTMCALLLTAERSVPLSATIAVGLVALGAFTWRELAAPLPFIDLRLIASARGLGATILRQSVTMFVMFTLFYGGGQWLAQAHGATPADIGIIMVPIAFVAMASAGGFARSITPRMGLVLGYAGAFVSCILLLFVGPGTPLWLIAAIIGISGLLNGFNGVANQAALYAQAPAAHVGVASGLFRTMQYVGGLSSTTLMAFLFAVRASDAAFHTLCVVLAGVCVFLTVAAFADRTIPARYSVRVSG